MTQPNYTDVAAQVVRNLMAGTQVRGEVTGQMTPLNTTKAWIVTGNDWGGKEGLAIYADVPALHDIGVNTAGNALQRVLRQIPEIAKHFDYRINGIPSAVLANHIEKLLTPLGIDAKKFSQWQGLNDKTEMPDICADNSSDSTSVTFEPVTGEKKSKEAGATNTVQTHSLFKDMAHLIASQHDAIMASIVKHAAALKDEHGKPVFSQEQLTALGQEKLLIKEYEGSLWQDITFSIGKLKSDEATAKKAANELNASDIAGSVLGTLSNKALENLVVDAVLEAVPQLYPKLVDRERFVADLKKATEGKVDITDLLHCSQLMKDSLNGRIHLSEPNNTDNKPFMDINTVDGASHPHTLKIDLPLPAGVHASEVIRSIIAFGLEKGLVPNAAPAPAAAPAKPHSAANDNPHMQATNTIEGGSGSFWGRLASGFGLFSGPKVA